MEQRSPIKQLTKSLKAKSLKGWVEEKIEEKLQKYESSKRNRRKIKGKNWKKFPSPEAVQRITPLAAEELLKIQEDPEKTKTIENKVVAFLSQRIDENHEKIGDLLEENIGKMSDGELVSFIKDNTGDLQMIRLNGMAFGVLVSIAVFIVKAVLGVL